MDADFSHDPKYLPEMAAATSDADLVIGSRYLNGISVVNWPLRRIILSTFANRYIRAVTGMNSHDCTTGYRCWRRESAPFVTPPRRDKVAASIAAWASATPARSSRGRAA
jgi:glycosyltransferase involved in cell wall biosynthesis